MNDLIFDMMLDTARCRIRPFKSNDIDAFMAYRNDMVWMQYQGFKGLTKSEYLKSLLAQHSLVEGIQLAVICKDTAALIGDLYLKQDGDIYWIGYTITPAMSRQGYAYEAVSAIIDYLAAQGGTCVKAGVENGNEASIELLKKLNFVFLCEEDSELIFSKNLT